MTILKRTTVLFIWQLCVNINEGEVLHTETIKRANMLLNLTIDNGNVSHHKLQMIKKKKITIIQQLQLQL